MTARERADRIGTLCDGFVRQTHLGNTEQAEAYRDRVNQHWTRLVSHIEQLEAEHVARMEG